MLIKTIDSVILYVSDIDRSVPWYRDVLELELRSRFDHFAVFELGETTLALHLENPPSDTKGSPSSMPVLLVGNFENAKATLEARGCEFVYENHLPHANFGTFLDPDQNPIQIIERL
jgi:catechol 2,3-dioxygenase-like lactoylglutathione lyase family enzyme